MESSGRVLPWQVAARQGCGSIRRVFATWLFFRARRTTVTSNLEPSRLPVDPIQFPRTTIAGCKGRPLASGGVLSFSQIQYPSKNPISGNILTPVSRSGMQPAVSTLSPKISRAKALVRFSRYKAAQEAAPGTKLDLNRLKLRRRGRLVAYRVMTRITRAKSCWLG